MPVTVFVCTQCDVGHHPVTGKKQANPQARTLVTSLRKLLANHTNIQVFLTRCMGNCDFPLSYAFTGEGRETILFNNGGNIPAEVIAQAVHTYATKRPGTRYQRSDIPPEQKGTIFARIPSHKGPKA